MHLYLSESQCHFLCSWDAASRADVLDQLQIQVSTGETPTTGFVVEGTELISLVTIVLADDNSENRKKGLELILLLLACSVFISDLELQAISQFLLPVLLQLALHGEDAHRMSLLQLYLKLVELPFDVESTVFLLRGISEFCTDKGIQTSWRAIAISSIYQALLKVEEGQKKLFIISQLLSKQVLEDGSVLPPARDNDMASEDFFEPSEESFFEHCGTRSAPAIRKGKNFITSKNKTYSHSFTGLFLSLLEDQEQEIRQATSELLFSLLNHSTDEPYEILLISQLSDLLFDESTHVMLFVLASLRDRVFHCPIPVQTISFISILLQCKTLTIARDTSHHLIRSWRIEDVEPFFLVIQSLLFCMEKKVDPDAILLQTASILGERNAPLISNTSVWTRLLHVDPSYLPVEPSLLDGFCTFVVLIS